MIVVKALTQLSPCRLKNCTFNHESCKILWLLNHKQSKIWCKSPSARLGDQAMIAIRPVGETCHAHKSVPDIETNVRPILSDIAEPGWLMVRDIQYLQKFAAAATAAAANPAVPAARRRHSLPFSTILTRLTRHPPSTSFPNRSFGLYRFLLFPYTLVGMHDSESRSGRNLFWKIQCHPQSRSFPWLGKE